MRFTVLRMFKFKVNVVKHYKCGNTVQFQNKFISYTQQPEEGATMQTVV